MAEVAEDRVARLLREAEPRGLLDTTYAQGLIFEMLEAGLRAKPELVERLERLYREEDERTERDGITTTIDVIHSLSEALGRELPDGLESKNLEQLDELHKELFMVWSAKNEADKQTVLRLQRELGPLVRVSLERSVVAPEALAEEAKRLWLEGVNAADLASNLSVTLEPGLTYDKVDARLHDEHVKPIVEAQANK